MNIKKISKLFEKGNVSVVGEKGAGKDMLVSNVIAHRRLPYVSNSRYDRKKGLPIPYYKLDFDKIDLNGNTYKDFINGTLKPYVYPYPIGTDVYITDAGIYLPAQYCNELNRDYKYIATLAAISRHLGFNVHTNCQNLNRVFDKLREQSRTYITCLWCKVLPIGKKNELVIQRIRIYEKYDSCANNVPSLKLPLSCIIGKDSVMGRLYKINYRILHGEIKEYTLIYFNKSNYDTHLFREMLKPKDEVISIENIEEIEKLYT